MLEFVRKWLKGPVAVGILALIAIPLAITFGRMDAGTSAGNTAAQVNGEPIAMRDFDRIYQDQLALEQQAATGPLPPGLANDLKQRVLDQLVLNRAVSQFVRDLDFRASDARVAEAIRKQPAFQVGGEFSKTAYEAALASRGISPTLYEEDQRSFLGLAQLQDSLLAGAFLTPAEYRRYLQLELERRTAAWVVLDATAIAGDLPVSDADIEQFHAANPDLFRSEESVALEYIETAVADLGRDYVPDEAAIRAAYDSAEPGRFFTAEERRSRHILLAITPERDEAATLKLATELAGRLAGGADFAALAREYSSDTGSAGRGGDLGFTARGAYVPEFDEALFNLAPGKVSAPVRTQFGFHLIRLDEVKPGSERSFDQVRAEIADELRQARAQDEFVALAERLDDLALENPGSLEPVANATGLPVRRIDPFTRTGGGPLGGDPRLVDAIFEAGVLTGEENTRLIELDGGRALVARVAEHRLAEPKPLAQVRGEVIERLRAQRGAGVARERGEALVKQLEQGADITTAAAGLPLVGPLEVNRRATVVPPELLNAIFRAPRPTAGPVARGVELPTGYAVFRLDAVRSGNPDEVPRELRDQRKQQLARQVGLTEVETLASALKSTAKVSVSPDIFRETDDL
jgi:peptidyl-prolyl cis-trans isomerase D